MFIKKQQQQQQQTNQLTLNKISKLCGVLTCPNPILLLPSSQGSLENQSLVTTAAVKTNSKPGTKEARINVKFSKGPILTIWPAWQVLSLFDQTQSSLMCIVLSTAFLLKTISSKCLMLQLPEGDLSVAANKGLTKKLRNEMSKGFWKALIIVLGIQKVIDMCGGSGRPDKALIFHFWVTLRLSSNAQTQSLLAKAGRKSIGSRHLKTELTSKNSECTELAQESH